MGLYHCESLTPGVLRVKISTRPSKKIEKENISETLIEILGWSEQRLSLLEETIIRYVYLREAKSIYGQAKEPNVRNNLIKTVIYSLCTSLEELGKGLRHCEEVFHRACYHCLF